MTTTRRREEGLEKSLSSALNKQIKGARVLLVGAGGIGCEVLKNLVCCGFGSATQNDLPKQSGITLIDLDTIDLSNLNRQFLFRKRHIKKSKAYVAKETASAYNPAVHIDAQHASIFDEQYSVQFFESFDIVFNALDNVPARRHVNRMCLAANVPLIESGTTGYNGQVQSIKKGLTECYDCNEKPAQKTFAICTIRSTPSQPIHCIVWAKSYLLPELFGVSEETTEMQVTEQDNEEEVKKLQEESQALKKIRSMIREKSFAQLVFDKVYDQDIHRLRSMTDMWKSKKAPEPLSFDANIWTEDPVQRGKSTALQEQRVWTMEENTAVFCSSIDALAARVKAGESTIEFDKDDKDTMDFVTAAANLRAHIFGIPLNSEWQIKQMAGNIIPAIATSNAITASLCVMQAFKIMRGKKAEKLGGSKMTFLTSKSTERMISTEALRPPNPYCSVCSPIYAKLTLPAQDVTLQQLVDLIKNATKLEEFSISIQQGSIYDPEEEDNLTKTLSSFGIKPNSNDFIIVKDDDDKPKVDLVLSVAVGDALVLQPASFELPEKAMPAEPSDTTLTLGTKRKREDDEEETSKKAKLDTNGTASDVIDVDDDGTILLDD